MLLSMLSCSWRCRFDSRIPLLGGAMRVFIERIFRKALIGLERHAFPRQ